MDNNNINHRLINLYHNLLQYTFVSFSQTIDTIQQIQSSIREISNNMNQANTNTNTNTNRFNRTRRARTQPNLTLNTNRNNSRDQELINELNQINDLVSQVSNLNNNEVSRINIGNSRNRMYYGGMVGDLYDNRNNTEMMYSLQPSNRTREISNTYHNELIYNYLRRVNNANTRIYENLSPVVVRPTREQIDNATEIIQYNDSLETTVCPITQESFAENENLRRIYHCGHYFNEEALNRWFTSSVFCPLCRYDIRNYNSNTSPDNSNNSLNYVSDISVNENVNEEHRENNNNVFLENLTDHLLNSLTSYMQTADLSSTQLRDLNMPTAVNLEYIIQPLSTGRLNIDISNNLS